MAFISVTNTFTNGTTADASQVNANFTNLVDGLKDTTKDLSVAKITAAGNILFDGGTFIFNEAGGDKDARFEGDTDANLLFLDASTDRIGIGLSDPSQKLEVKGNLLLDAETDVQLRFEDTNAFKGALAYNNITEDMELFTKASVSDPVVIFKGNGGFLFNEGGASVDFQLQSNTDANMFFMDGSEDKIGIGTSSPISFLHAQRDTTQNDFTIDLFAATNTVENFITFRRGLSNTRGTFTETTDLTIIGGFEFLGSGDDDAVEGSGSKFFVQQSSQAGSASTPADFIWQASSTGTTPTIEKMRLDARGNLILGQTDLGLTTEINVFVLQNGGAPSGGTANAVKLYSEDVSAKAEMKAMDEDGNVTTLTPHNFSLIPEGPSEDMAWSFYSKRGSKEINVDMLKMARLLEKVTGEKLVYIK